ncbi:hypothetical protein DSM104443_02396 [Usitatibacter rugosus]|uniref:Acyltransferase 3 domain-containing protein n=1 Tax=Usitatibacter rugosus TaxID=2732067 RepID=A0A6M4GVJ6_9PROT|nr:acyltransferase [Usitatibacter rugosus]QJR11321.1 hypothetical protein DSM104443_02396 [Usitatibacter rugosus]
MTANVLRDVHPEQGVRAEVGEIAAIEALRGVAVLWVILFHYWVLRVDAFPKDPWNAFIASVPPLRAIVSNGYLGVELFFLITGFLLTLPWFRHALQGRPAPSARGFYVRRIRRIVPAYYVQLFFLIVVFVPLYYGSNYWMRNLGYLAYNIPAHLSFLHYTTPLSSASMNVNGALWTLTLEAQYYVILPLLAPLFVRAPWRTLVALLVIATAWRWFSLHDMNAFVAWQKSLAYKDVPESAIRHLVETQLPAFLGHFALGVMLGRAWLLSKGGWSPATTAAWVVAACGGLTMVYLVHSSLPGFFGGSTWATAPIAFALAMHVAITVAPRIGQALAIAPLRFLGRISYSAYLYHLPFLFNWNLYGPADWGWMSFATYATMVLAVSYLSYRFVEIPFMKPARKEPWPTNAAPGASGAPSTSPTTTASGDAPSTTIASSSNS